MVEYLLSILKNLGSLPSMEKTERDRKERKKILFLYDTTQDLKLTSQSMNACITKSLFQKVTCLLSALQYKGQFLFPVLF
jgi:hypothetical protein